MQAYNTVTARSRVDGEIIKIAFKEGQIVKEGDLLVQLDPRPFQAALDQAVAKKAQDEASLKNAQLDLKRFTDLARQDFASRQQVDTQQATVDQFTAQIKGDQAAIDNAKTQLSYTTINAPISGRIGFRLVDQGNIVHASDTNGMLSIVQLQPISVVFTAPEEDVPRINKALAAGPVPVTALSSDGSRTLSQGKLALIDNTVDQASGTIRMKATFENKDNVLWPGLSVSTRLLVETLKQVVVVPNDAVERGPNGLYAFVIDDANKVEMHDIKVSQEGTDQSVVTQGVSSGQKVVVGGSISVAGRLHGRSRMRLRLPGRPKRRRTPPKRRPDHGRRHLRAVHSASDRDLAPDDRGVVRRPRRLSAAAGRAACRRWISRRSKSPRACPEPAPTPWPRRWRSRSRRNSPRFRASRR